MTDLSRTPAATADDERAQREQRVRRLAHLLDDAVRVPGTERRVGLDGLLGLIPGLGDLTSLGLAGVVVLEAVRLGAHGATLARMLANVAVDAVLGAVPVLGWIADFGFKANRRNVALLERHVVDEEGTRRSSRRALVVAGAGMALVTLGAVALAVWLVVLLVGALT